MRTRNISIVVAISALTALGSTAFAASPHDSYNRTLGIDSTPSGLSDTMGKAAYGTPTSSTAAWSGHESYNRALSGVEASPSGQPDTMGKAAFGSASGPDGNAIYSGVFVSD